MASLVGAVKLPLSPCKRDSTAQDHGQCVTPMITNSRNDIYALCHRAQ